MKNCRIRTLGEALESRRLLSAITFVEHPHYPGCSLWCELADVDNDGDVDLIDNGPNGLSLFKNDGQRLSESVLIDAPQAVVTIPGRILAVDFDGDNDLDILQPGPELRWYENVDAMGNFSIVHTVPKGDLLVSEAGNAVVIDMDGDDDLDVVTAWRQASNSSAMHLTWHENTDGMGRFGEPLVIADNRDYAFLSAGNLDEDEDIEILSGGWWYDKNIDSGYDSVSLPINGWPTLVDLDLDRDIDLLYLADSRALQTFVNNGSGGFTSGQIIDEQSPITDFVVMDFDQDNAPDIAISTSSGIALYKNLRNGEFDKTFEHFVAVHPFYLNSADFDGDGDFDLLAQPMWFENRIIGDSNDDRIFESADLVAVFRAGKFETDAEASFEEGDWNQDGVFDSTDIVLAFQSGHYIFAITPFTKQLAAAIDQLFTDDWDDRDVRDVREI